MRFYECIFIVHPAVPEEEIDQIIELVSEMITTQNGEILKVEKWGKRKIAYEVKKERYGFYVFIYFKSLPPVIRQLDHRFNLHEKVIRHMIVKTEEKSPEEFKPVATNEVTETPEE